MKNEECGNLRRDGAVGMDCAVECVEDYGFKGGEVRALAGLQFVARNLDSGGELRGKIEV